MIIIHSADSKSTEEIQIRIITRICSGTLHVNIKGICLWNVNSHQSSLHCEYPQESRREHMGRYSLLQKDETTNDSTRDSVLSQLPPSSPSDSLNSFLCSCCPPRNDSFDAFLLIISCRKCQPDEPISDVKLEADD